MKISFGDAMAAGAGAGFIVDMSIHPIDTIRTRQQSSPGFWNSGGFRNIFKGIGATISGSSPSAAMFFATYEKSKSLIKSNLNIPDPIIHSLSAAIGEISACLVRVPTENIKQTTQVGI